MENKLCDPDAFAACFREVEGSLPATWAPSCSATELHAHLQKPEVGLPTAYVNRKHPKLVYRVLLSRPAVGVTGQPGLVQLVAGHQWTYMQAEVVNALARREIAGLKTVVPPMWKEEHGYNVEPQNCCIHQKCQHGWKCGKRPKNKTHKTTKNKTTMVP